MKMRSIAVVLTGAMIFGNVQFVFAQGFEGREDEMNQKCAVVTDTATLNECKEYRVYLEEKSKNLDSQISNIKNQVSDIQGDVDKIAAVVKENTTKIQGYDKQMQDLQLTINDIQYNIDTLNLQIDKKQIEIKERDERMKKRLVEMQAFIGTNNYIDFIMGSTGFSDLLRRTQIVSELNTYESDQIEQISKEKKQLNKDKEVVEVQKDILEIQKKSIDDNKKVAEALNATNNELIATYHQKQTDLDAQRIETEMMSASIKASLPTISTTIPPELGGGNTGNGNTDNGNSNTGKPDDGNTDNGDNGNGNTDNGGGSSGSGLSTYLQSPMSRNVWNYYSGTWSYPGGGIHLGMDMSTGNTTRLPIVAPAAGIVLTTYSGCPEYGGIGNHCGLAWAGNAVLMAVQLANGEAYIIGMYHMYTPSVSAGQIVSQGQQIGLSGSSGNSDGPHCHIEITYLGNKSLQEVLNIWNTNKDVSFGLGWTSTNSCGGAPCRMRPENFFL